MFLWFVKFRNLLDFFSILPVLVAQNKMLLHDDPLLAKSTVFHHVLRLAQLVRIVRLLSFLDGVQAIDLMFKIIDDVYHSTRGGWVEAKKYSILPNPCIALRSILYLSHTPHLFTLRFPLQSRPAVPLSPCNHH